MLFSLCSIRLTIWGGFIAERNIDFLEAKQNKRILLASHVRVSMFKGNIVNICKAINSQIDIQILFEITF